MVTQFIKQKDVRKKFNDVFIKPEIDNCTLLNNPTVYNAPLLGNALDYFITCHFNYLNKSESDSFLENVNFWLIKLKENRLHDITPEIKVGVINITQRTVKCHFNFLNKNEIDGFIKKTKKIQDKIEKLYSAFTGKNKKGITRTLRTITCNFKFTNENKNDQFRKESKLLLDELKNNYITDTVTGIKSREKEYKELPEGRVYRCFKHTNGYIDYGLLSCSKSEAESLVRWVNGELIYCYCEDEISEFIEFALIKYKDYQVRGKITNSFLNALLILAKILPGIFHQRLGKNLFEYNSKNDLEMLKHLIKQIPKDFYKAKQVLINPNLSCGMVRGEPDYIIDNSIIDIKTTQHFFSRVDYNQLICYYLLYKIDEKRWNEQGIQINKIGIYYALYGKFIHFNVSDLCSPEALKEMMELIEDYY